MKEQQYQAKIIKAIESRGGHVINGQFTRAGEADLQCGYPVDIGTPGVNKDIALFYLAVEVKTEKDYHRVMKCIETYTNDDGIELIKPNGQKGLKSHESLQIAKISNVRRKGGLAIIAYSFEQVEQYVKDNT